jgi:hypothetical protein
MNANQQSLKGASQPVERAEIVALGQALSPEILSGVRSPMIDKAIANVTARMTEGGEDRVELLGTNFLKELKTQLDSIDPSAAGLREQTARHLFANADMLAKIVAKLPQDIMKVSDVMDYLQKSEIFPWVSQVVTLPIPHGLRERTSKGWEIRTGPFGLFLTRELGELFSEIISHYKRNGSQRRIVDGHTQDDYIVHRQGLLGNHAETKLRKNPEIDVWIIFDTMMEYGLGLPEEEIELDELLDRMRKIIKKHFVMEKGLETRVDAIFANIGSHILEKLAPFLYEAYQSIQTHDVANTKTLIYLLCGYLVADSSNSKLREKAFMEAVNNPGKIKIDESPHVAQSIPVFEGLEQVRAGLIEYMKVAVIREGEINEISKQIAARCVDAVGELEDFVAEYNKRIFNWVNIANPLKQKKMRKECGFEKWTSEQDAIAEREKRAIAAIYKGLDFCGQLDNIGRVYARNGYTNKQRAEGEVMIELAKLYGEMLGERAVEVEAKLKTTASLEELFEQVQALSGLVGDKSGVQQLAGKVAEAEAYQEAFEQAYTEQSDADERSPEVLDRQLRIAMRELNEGQ